MCINIACIPHGNNLVPTYRYTDIHADMFSLASKGPRSTVVAFDFRIEHVVKLVKGEVHPKTKFRLKALFTSKKHQAA